MKKVIRYVLPLLMTTANGIALAAEEATNGAEEVGFVEGFLISWLPMILLIGVFIYFLKWIGRKNNPVMDRSMVHMERLEKQQERIIELLEQMNESKRENSEQTHNTNA